MKNNKSLLKKILFASFFLLNFEALWAESKVASLADYLLNEVSSLDNALAGVEMGVNSPESLDDVNKSDTYFFRRFWLRLRPRVERDIPGFASLSIIPETELLWEQQTPEGWEMYKIKGQK